MIARKSKARSAAVAAAFFVAGAAACPVRAADLDVVVTPHYSTYGVDCQGPEAKSFESVWLGHFTGGESAYSGAGGSVLLDWHDDKLCFPSRRSCEQWVAGMHRDFHRPPGYFTCLPIR
jgi:hypothetical protein